MTNLPIVVGLGEILWDVFPEGPRFGGAPANFACHVASLGGQAHIVSAVGSDDFGEEAFQALCGHQVVTDYVAKSSRHPTGAVQIQVDGDGQPSYRFGTDDAWDHLEWSDELADLAARTDAVCFGTLGQRSPPSRATIQRFVESVPVEALRVFDINLRPPYFHDASIQQSLQIANVLKLNDDELEHLTTKFNLLGSQAERLRQLADRFELRLVALTRGELGAVLIRGTELSECAGVEVKVQDTVGAGDAFTAVVILRTLQGLELDLVNRQACQLAAYVCSQTGATPRLPANGLP